MFLDRYHPEEQLVQKAGPQTGVPFTREHRGDRSKDECWGLRAEKDIAKLWCVESHHKPAKRLESFSLATRERREGRG